MNPSPTAQNIKHVGLDVHGETIAIAIAEHSGEVRSYGKLPSHTQSIDRLHKKLSEKGGVVLHVYEALSTVPRPRDGWLGTCEITCLA